MPPEDGQTPKPQAPPVTPQPTPAAWQISKVGATEQGEAVFAVTLWLVTGSTTVFLNGTELRKLADDLRGHTTGLTIADGPLPGSN